ncbi:ABC transporter ATP-binding protein [Novosphingobium sp. NPDC080210]|uniref:ABC transporter ATP-binding protein n=1 Tax=Novosphingobium sp. NPDC080210 TaxID=3390596 RepID=UPI003D01B755
MMLAAQDLMLDRRLNGVSVALQAGQVTAICGPNGAGKSSLLACLAGLLTPQAGAVNLEGAALSSLAPRERARVLGYLPQQGEVAWDLSVYTLVSLGRLPWNAGAAADRAAVDAALAVLDLEGLRQRPLSSLSGGEQARVLLARVLAGEPRWILADEPLANLDLAHQLGLLGQFRALAAQGVGVCLVLHDLAQAMNHADRVIVLDSGMVAADGPPHEALTEALIEQVWKVPVRWLGEPGQRALVAG